MGRLGSLFKKSDDKGKNARDAPENPYAQQPPAGQQSAPSQSDPYTQFNNNQYNGNRFASQPSGLPSGPRPGGLPSQVAPGPRPGPPPSYSSYDRSSSATSGPAMGTGFPKDKYGAADGFGKNRFDTPDSNSSGGPRPSPRPGGYGNLDPDDGRSALFAGYNGAAKQTPGPRSDVPGGPGYGAMPGTQQTFVDKSQMTEEEREQYEYDEIKNEVNQVRNETEDSLDRSLARAREARERNAQMLESLNRQGEMLAHANQLTVETEVQAKRGDLNVKDLHDATGSMFKVFTARKRADKLNDEKLRQDLEAKQLRQQAQALKRDGFGRQQQELPSRKPQTLGTRADPAHRKRFVLEEEDEEQEARIDDKLEELNDIVSGVRLDAKKMNNVLAEQDVLIRKMAERTDRVQDNLIATQNRMDRIR
ncbi:hypothetical protein VTJ49DRAFT_7267 [Mycothermus thermophilus]|uniref:t-SNARE coiled-coil homology domain-containing protein n=1 Tax=Humicola insolens TaxID=85995 RepID=A0ABR3VHI1_HUMIN